jgi:hypothetical protein
MTDLKKLQEDNAGNNKLDYKTTEDFPSYYRSYLHFSLDFGDDFAGLNLSYQSTGARTTYSDYSGEHTIDQIINGLEIGLFYNYSIVNRNNSKLYFGMQANSIISTLKLKEEISFFEQHISESSEERGKSIGLNIGAQLGYRYSIDSFFIGVEGGYVLNPVNSGFKFNEGKSKLKADWSGYRISVTIGLKFKSGKGAGAG